MKYIILTCIALSLTSCSKINSKETYRYFKNSAFIEINDTDTTWLSFTDSTYQSWTNSGELQNGFWRTKQIKNLDLLILGSFCPSVYSIVQFSDNKCTIQSIGRKDDKIFTMEKISSKALNLKIEKIESVVKIE